MTISNHLYTHIGEGNGNPLQCSCLEISTDRGAWWAAVYGVAQSPTWLKRLGSSNAHLHDHGDNYAELPTTSKHSASFLFHPVILFSLPFKPSPRVSSSPALIQSTNWTQSQHLFTAAFWFQRTNYISVSNAIPFFKNLKTYWLKKNLKFSSFLMW